MKLEDAQKIVAETLEWRRRFSKMFTVADMPPEFLDALVMVHEAEASMRATTSGEDLEAAQKLIAEQKDTITLLNRQLGMAKTRETGLRKGLTSERAKVKDLITAMDGGLEPAERFGG